MSEKANEYATAIEEWIVEKHAAAQKWTQIPNVFLTVSEPQKAVDYDGRPLPGGWTLTEVCQHFGVLPEQVRNPKPAPLHPLRGMSAQPNGFGQSMWRPWE
jgi:hypothetical protein